MPYARKPPLLNIWMQMRYRCQNPKHTSYKWYGAKGIKVCKRWEIFKNFEADMSPRPDGFSLDRINPLGDYELDNCRWASQREQNRNSTKTRYITIKGIEYRAIDLSEKTGVPVGTIIYRVAQGLSFSEVTSPTRRTNKGKKLVATEWNFAAWKRNSIRRIARTHCKRGHEFTKENTWHRPGRGRECRICVRLLQIERLRRFRDRKKEKAAEL